MIPSFTTSDFVHAIRSLQIDEEAVLLTSASFFKLGRLEGVRDSKEYYGSLFSSLQKAVGPRATLVANTYTADVGASGQPFNWNSTDTTAGPMENLLLQQEGVHRSVHPLQSVGALGPAAAHVCSAERHTNFGIGSPYDRFLNTAKPYVLRIGLDPYFNALAHHAEALLGVPYCYFKMLDCSVLRDGHEIPGPWYATVRYLHIQVEYGTRKLQEALTREGLIKSIPVGAAMVCLIDAKAYFDLVIREMIHDPFFLLTSDPEIPSGLPPRDGPTAKNASTNIVHRWPT